MRGVRFSETKSDTDDGANITLVFIQLCFSRI